MRAFKKSGVAIAFISHNLSAVAALCDRVVVVDRGRVVTIAPPDEAFRVYSAQTLPAKTAAAARPSLLTMTDDSNVALTSVAAGQEIVVRGTIPAGNWRDSISSGVRVYHVETGEIVYRTTGPSVGAPSITPRAHSDVAIEWRLHANLCRGLYYIEVVVFETIHREVLSSLRTAQFMVVEQESEGGRAHMAARCVIAAAPEMTAAGGPASR
jgi:hypothetical protein